MCSFSTTRRRSDASGHTQRTQFAAACTRAYFCGLTVVSTVMLETASGLCRTPPLHRRGRKVHVSAGLRFCHPARLLAQLPAARGHPGNRACYSARHWTGVCPGRVVLDVWYVGLAGSCTRRASSGTTPGRRPMACPATRDANEPRRAGLALVHLI